MHNYILVYITLHLSNGHFFSGNGAVALPVYTALPKLSGPGVQPLPRDRSSWCRNLGGLLQLFHHKHYCRDGQI